MDFPVNLEVRRQRTAERYPCQLCFLDKGDSSQVEELQGYILETLENKESFFPLTPAEIGNILTKEGGLALGAFVGNQLIGFGAVYFPKDNADNLGRDVGLDESELKQVVHLEVCFVHPDYRGNALQTKMGKILIKQVSLLNEFRYLFSTVMPANIPSITDKFVQKMKIVALKQKYNNSWRYIFYRDLWTEERMAEGKIISVPSMNIPRQLTLLNHCYQGIGYRKTGTGLEILYSKKAN